MPFRALGYFLNTAKIIGLRAAIIFSLYYVFYKIIAGLQQDYKIPVGNFTLNFPSLEQFAGLFTEIFIKRFYYLEKTDKPIIAIDCGANIGVSLLYIKVRAPNARVTCFEPNPAARQFLEKNIKENGWGKSVFVYPYALGKASTTANFYVESAMNTSNSGSLDINLASKKSSINSLSVEIRRLSNFIKSPIDFLKIDIEGGEFDVFDDLVENKKIEKISKIQFEYHKHPKFSEKTIEKTIQIIQEAGFKTSFFPTSKTENAHMVHAWRSTPFQPIIAS